jgi:hypothetical protein
MRRVNLRNGLTIIPLTSSADADIVPALNCTFFF